MYLNVHYDNIWHNAYSNIIVFLFKQGTLHHVVDVLNMDCSRTVSDSGPNGRSLSTDVSPIPEKYGVQE